MSLAPNLLQILSIPLLLPPNSLLLVWGWQNSRARQGWGRQLQTVKNKDTRPEIIWLPWHCPLCQALCSPSGDLLNWGCREAACSQEPAGRVLLAPTVTEPNPSLACCKMQAMYWHWVVMKERIVFTVGTKEGKWVAQTQKTWSDGPQGRSFKGHVWGEVCKGHDFLLIHWWW